MDFLNHPQFKIFEKEVNEAIKANYNILIVSLPGSGATFFIKKYVEKYKKNKIGYITQERMVTRRFNFLDLDFNKDGRVLKVADNYIKNAEVEQKFAVVVNNPSFIDTDTFKKSTLSRHYYKIIWIKSMDVDRAKILIDDCSSKVTEKELKEILKLTGGIARLTRYFVLSPEKTKLDYKNLVEDKSFRHIFIPTVELISKCNDSDLEKLDVKKNEKFIGSLVESYFSNNPIQPKYDLVVKADGSILENGIKSNFIFLNIEKQIIQRAIQANNLTTKEDISEVKWGKDSYDEYSDQAIKKTIQRINKKLTKFVFTAVPTIGYRLESM